MHGTCPVCGEEVKLLVRVGAYLFTEPCAHRILDLRQFEWFRRYERKHNRAPQRAGEGG